MQDGSDRARPGSPTTGFVERDSSLPTPQTEKPHSRHTSVRRAPGYTATSEARNCANFETPKRLSLSREGLLRLSSTRLAMSRDMGRSTALRRESPRWPLLATSRFINADWRQRRLATCASLHVPTFLERRKRVVSPSPPEQGTNRPLGWTDGGRIRPRTH